MMIRTSLLAVLILASGLFYLAQQTDSFLIPTYGFGDAVAAEAHGDGSKGSMLFVGDVMLGRAVETYMEEKGSGYPFYRIESLIKDVDVAVGNFEAPVPQTHVHTPDLEMQFSVRAPYLGQLRASGFEGLSLANNHARDHGEAAYTHTLSTCAFYELTCSGHPNRIDHTSVQYHDLGDTRVGILMLNDTNNAIDPLALGIQLSKMEFYSDIQIVFIHWGVEYEHTWSTRQQELAHTLIDNGIDAVIGHHPHVVQGIEKYHGKPIFYSLGNFIFDQYFSEAVQRGLVVRMNVHDDSIEYQLHGITSIGSPSQPRPMNPEEQTEFIEMIASVSERELVEELRNGMVTVPR